MSEQNYHRLGIAQLSFNPAYLDDSGVSFLHEPVFPIEAAHGLHKLGGLPEIRDLRARIAAAFVDHMSHKIKAVIETAAAWRVELIVLPEYSVPVELLEECKSLSQKFDMVVVAGSHTVTRPAVAEYARLKIGQSSQEPVLNSAVCPIFLPTGECHLVEKVHRSKSEPALVPGRPGAAVPLVIGKQNVQLQVLLCIDALAETRGDRARRGKVTPVVTAMPSLTPDAKLFYDRGELLLASGKVTLFANIAEFGGSKIFARGERTAGWFAASDGTEPLPKFSEALVLIEADLSGQFDVRKSTQEHFPVRSVAVMPLVYAQHSEVCREFLEFAATVGAQSESDPNLLESTRRFVSQDYRRFPRLMQDKLAHFIEHVAGPGLADREAWSRWLTPVGVQTTPSIDALRWELCSRAFETVNELTSSDRYPEKTDILMATYKFLVTKRQELKSRLETPNPKSAAPVSVSSDELLPAHSDLASFEPPFFDRDPIFGFLQNFIGSSDKACFVLAGMRGMGKTSIARQAFKKVIPPTWKRVFISLTDGASYPRLLGELAHQLGLRLPPDSSLDASAKQIDLEQNLFLTLSHTPRLALFLDDFQYLLEPNGELEERTGRFVAQLIRVASTRRNKLIIVTNQIPKLEGDILHLVDSKYIKGLEQKDSENLFSYWFRFEREDLSGQPIHYPEKLLRVLSGHPLAVKVAAKLVAERTTDAVESETAIFRRLRETIVPFFLDRVQLSEAEDELVRFASIFRLPVRRDAFIAWKADKAGFLLDSLLGRSLLETDGEEYGLHPIIREHFYTSTPLADLRPFHKAAGAYFLDLYHKTKTATREPNPEFLGEAIHHYLCAGDREKVKSFAFYKYELRPVAFSHFKRHEFDLALREYRILNELDPNDPDPHFHLALIYARRKEWDRAEAHFGKAMRLKPSGYWILQGYAHVKLAANQIEEAEQLLQKAIEINPRHSPTLIDLGIANARMGEEVVAESYFRDAIDADPNNTFAYTAYARFLLRTQRYSEGLEMALAAMESNPRDNRNKQLVEELRARLEGAKGAGGM
jgi:Flp pilus assembly protein TadD